MEYQEENIHSEDDIDLRDEFNPDELDLKELDAETVDDESEPLTGKIPPFLARLQWWGFGALLIFIIIVILRMIFGPPWMDRFLNPRYPVTMDANDKLIATITPIFAKSKGFTYRLVLVDYNGTIIHQEDLGRVQGGPLDIALGNEFYYYIVGGGTWIGVRSYDKSSGLNYDIDLNQFNYKYRDGLSVVHPPKGNRELLEVFTESRILVLERKGVVWENLLERDTISWEPGLEIVDLSGSLALLSSGPAFFVAPLDNFLMPQERFYVPAIQKRPLYPAEFVYKPAVISEIPNSQKGFIVVKNDRMFNLSYKYSDDQCFIKKPDVKDLETIRHPYFNGRDIRGAMHVNPENPDSSYKTEFLVLSEYENEYHLVALKLDVDTPLWEVTLGRSSVD